MPPDQLVPPTSQDPFGRLHHLRPGRPRAGLDPAHRRLFFPVATGPSQHPSCLRLVPQNHPRHQPFPWTLEHALPDGFLRERLECPTPFFQRSPTAPSLESFPAEPRHHRIAPAVQTPRTPPVISQRRDPSRHQFPSRIRASQDARLPLVLLPESKAGDPDRIQMQIPPHLVQSVLFQQQHRFEPALKDVSPATMRPIETTRVTGLEPANGVAEIGLTAADQHMVMVVHEHERVHLERETLRHLRQQSQEPVPIRIAAKDGFTPVSAAHDMVPSPGQIDSQRSRHRPIPRRPFDYVNGIDLTPLPLRNGVWRLL